MEILDRYEKSVIFPTGKINLPVEKHWQNTFAFFLLYGIETGNCPPYNVLEMKKLFEFRRKEEWTVERIEEKYQLMQRIGKGCSCEVYLARHKKMQQTCAVKCIPKKAEESRTFLKETEFLKNLKSIYIPVLYDFMEDENYWYLIEEYVSGPSLKNLKDSQKVISREKIAEIFVEICEAVQWLHEQKPYPVIYMDLKPEHIILGKGHVKLLDLGSAVYLRGRQAAGTVMGTEGFASPEQLQGGGIDTRSDIYSIGALLYWVITGEALRTGFTRIRGYGREWNPVLEACMKEQKKERYASVEVLKADILSIGKKGYQKQFKKSLKIAVIGSQNRIGVTHFSMGMCIAGAKAGASCLYEERNDHGAIQEMFLHNQTASEKNGIYDFGAFQAVPRYGKAVVEESYDGRLLIRDYGSVQETDMDMLSEEDLIIAVAGGKEWEWKYTKELADRCGDRENLYYVLRTGSRRNYRVQEDRLKPRNCFRMPCYENPFQLGRQELRFYSSLWRRLTESRRQNESRR